MFGTSKKKINEFVEPLKRPKDKKEKNNINVKIACLTSWSKTL